MREVDALAEQELLDLARRRRAAVDRVARRIVAADGTGDDELRVGDDGEVVTGAGLREERGERESVGTTTWGTAASERMSGR